MIDISLTDAGQALRKELRRHADDLAYVSFAGGQFRCPHCWKRDAMQPWVATARGSDTHDRWRCQSCKVIFQVPVP